MFAAYLLLTAALILLVDIFIKRRKLPPGPFPIPILGSLPYLIWKTYKHGSIANAMLQIKKDYGKVFTLWFGPIATISIADYELAHEAMIKQGNEFTNRWTPFVLRAANAANLGIVFSNGANWLEQRRFALHTLRNFGLGRNIMEQRVMDEYQFRTELLNEQLKVSSSIEAHRLFDITVGSVIHRLLVSTRYGKEDEAEFFDRKGKLDKAIEKTSFFDVCASEWVMKVPFVNKRYQKIIGVQFEIKDYFVKLIDQRQKSIFRGDNIYLKEKAMITWTHFCLRWRKTKEKHNTRWKISPVVKKVRAEVATVTGSKRTLSLQDKKTTPYLNATINEIQRYASIMSFNLWREASVDTSIRGYSIPKGTPTSAQISLILRDEQHFKNSDKFETSRFLNASLEQYMIPFGIRKRVCLGESLARAEFYLIVGNLIHDYELSPVGGVPPEMKPVTTQEAFMRRPVHYSMNLKKIVYN